MMRQRSTSALFLTMAFRLSDAKPLSEPMLTYCQLDRWKQGPMKLQPI